MERVIDKARFLGRKCSVIVNNCPECDGCALDDVCHEPSPCSVYVTARGLDLADDEWLLFRKVEDFTAEQSDIKGEQ